MSSHLGECHCGALVAPVACDDTARRPRGLACSQAAGCRLHSYDGVFVLKVAFGCQASLEFEKIKCGAPCAATPRVVRTKNLDGSGGCAMPARAGARNWLRGGGAGLRNEQDCDYLLFGDCVDQNLLPRCTTVVHSSRHMLSTVGEVAERLPSAPRCQRF